MTTIVEKKGQLGVVLGFLIVVFGLAAWRGAEGAPIIAAAAGIGAVGLAIWLVYYYRKPAAMLTITQEEIWYGRLDQPGMRIERDESGRLRFREGFKKSGWFLSLADHPDRPGLLMTGFDMKQVAEACVAHGWSFGEPDRF